MLLTMVVETDNIPAEMAARLKDEILQGRDFDSLETEAFLNILRTADLLKQQVEQALKSGDLSATQYNVLRILRGARPEGLPCTKIAERMVTHDPDVTRLLDRMEKRLLVERKRSATDRRVVVVSITKAGLDALEGMQAPVQEANRRQFSRLGEERLRRLIELLEAVRESGS
jgi:DNA-binding MarR family transcriptional regulator